MTSIVPVQSISGCERLSRGQMFKNFLDLKGIINSNNIIIPLAFNLQYFIIALHACQPYLIFFRSRHEEIELVDEENFFKNAPKEVSKPVSSRVWSLEFMLTLLFSF